MLEETFDLRMVALAEKLDAISESIRPVVEMSERLNLLSIESFFSALGTVGGGMVRIGQWILWLVRTSATVSLAMCAVLLVAYAFFDYAPPDRLIKWIALLKKVF